MPVLEREGVRIDYEVRGVPTEHAPVLLSHGFSASKRMWDRNLSALSSDREVLTWDMRGHADSEAPQDASLYGEAQTLGDMVTLLGRLQRPRAVLCGMSLGGYLSLALAAQHPERVAGLILVDTGPGFRSDEPREQWNRFAEQTAQALEDDGLSALSPSPEVGRHDDVVGLVHTARLVMAQRDATVIDSLARITVPTLVLVGSLDTNFLSAANYMAAKIPASRMVILEGAGHAANIEAAEVFNESVRDFLEQL
jgi:pimeloyl-ACP methyl ester carboxylesterase